MREDQIALQLYTVRELLAEDVPRTLRAVADSGYRFVEVAGVPEARSAELPSLLRDAGLQAIGVHVGIEALRRDPDALVGRLADLGTDRLIVPVIPDEDRLTPPDVSRFADEVSRFGSILADRGIRVGYHNHAFEFRDIGGTTTWDVLIERLAPEVELEIDVYWARVGGRDPVTLIESVADRVRLLHMKDLVSDPEPQDAPAGQGSLDFRAIAAAGRAAGVEWYIAEQDDPRAALEDIASAYGYLASIAD